MFQFLLVVLAVLSSTRAKSIDSSLDVKIVGGKTIQIEQVPYQLSLRISLRHDCGASIVAPKIALTAAHCTYGRNQDDITIHSGTSVLTDRGTVHYVDKIINHDKYDSDTVANDIALVFVKTAFTYGPKVQPVKMASSGQKFADGAMAVISGWGATYAGSPMSVDLKGTEVPIINFKKCQEFFDEPLTDGTICAGFKEGGKDTCQGDSGGPMVVKGVQVGVVSWGLGCGDANSPGVYSDVGYYRDWIKKNAKI